ncbi:hypothetical protein BS78_01G447700 [Paspalum vaginatum]|nr:hypothetical protein BS78_01G447700 [Paspalum vaginatum]
MDRCGRPLFSSRLGGGPPGSHRRRRVPACTSGAGAPSTKARRGKGADDRGPCKQCTDGCISWLALAQPCTRRRRRRARGALRSNGDHHNDSTARVASLSL